MSQTVTAADVFLFDEKSSILASFKHFNSCGISRGRILKQCHLPLIIHHKIQNKRSSSGKSSLGKDSAKKTSDHYLSIIQNKLGFVILGSNIF